MKTKTDKKGKRNLFAYFVSYYKPHKVTFMLDMLASLIVSRCGLFYPMLTRQMLNDFIPNGMVKEIVLFGIGLVGIYIVRACMNFYINYCGHVMGVKMQAAMRSDLFDHLQKLPYSYYDNHETGQLMARMTNDLFSVSELAHHGPENLFISSFMIVGSFVYLCTINWLLALIVFAFLPVIILVSIKAQNDMNNAFTQSREETGNINATLENSISGIRVTKAYANDVYEQDKFEKNNDAYVFWRSKAYKAMERYVAEGKIRSIGVSCYYVKEIDEFLPQVDIKPVLVQNEVHPYYQDTEVVEHLHRLGIVVEAWYPLGGRGHQGELLNDPVLSDIAARHGKSVVQVILRWHLQRGVVAIPGSSNPDHIEENISVFDFSLSDEEMARIAALNRNEKHDWY